MIKIDNVKKFYTDKVKIGPLDIEIPKAGFTSLIGPNGWKVYDTFDDWKTFRYGRRSNPGSKYGCF